jgi:lipoyl synthase
MGIDLEHASMHRRKPDWLKVRLPGGPGRARVKAVLERQRLHSICQEARCPNMAECFREGTATFLIMGNVCSRHCLYCNVIHGRPAALDENETDRLADAVAALDLKYAVITSVTRDDLPDGGASAFVRAIATLRERVPGCRVEVLVPDFQGNYEALKQVLDAGPDVLNHNMEVVSGLFPRLRPQGRYDVSLGVIRHAAQDGGAVVKSGFMVGLGESLRDIKGLLKDLRGAGCGHVTVGQYLQPTRDHYPVQKYYHPDEFEAIKKLAEGKGFGRVEAGPLVRSSYHAARAYPDGGSQHVMEHE